MSNQRDKKSPGNAYIRFSSLAIQMGLIITAGALGGNWLDKKSNNEFPVYTLILSLASIIIALYYVIKEVMQFSKELDKENKDEESAD